MEELLAHGADPVEYGVHGLVGVDRAGGVPLGHQPRRLRQAQPRRRRRRRRHHQPGQGPAHLGKEGKAKTELGTELRMESEEKVGRLWDELSLSDLERRSGFR